MTAKTRCTQTRRLRKNTFCIRQVFSRARPCSHRFKVAEGLSALCQGVSSARTRHICLAWWVGFEEGMARSLGVDLSWISAISGYFLLAGRCSVWVTNVWPALCKSPPRGVYLSHASVTEYTVWTPVWMCLPSNLKTLTSLPQGDTLPVWWETVRQWTAHCPSSSHHIHRSWSSLNRAKKKM